MSHLFGLIYEYLKGNTMTLNNKHKLSSFEWICT